MLPGASSKDYSEAYLKFQQHFVRTQVNGFGLSKSGLTQIRPNMLYHSQATFLANNYPFGLFVPASEGKWTTVFAPMVCILQAFSFTGVFGGFARATAFYGAMTLTC